MTIKVDLELAEVVGLLEHQIERAGWTREAISTELGWDVGPIFDHEKRPDIEQLFQILSVIDLHPLQFFQEVFGLPPRWASASPNDEHHLRLKLVRLLDENLQSFCLRLPWAHSKPGNLTHLAVKKIGDQISASQKELIALTDWMMGRLHPIDRQLLNGMHDRLGDFGIAVQAINDLLSIVEKSEDAAWAMEHQSMLLSQTLRDVDAFEDVHIAAVLFLLDLEIKAGRREDLVKLAQIREKLAASLREAK